MLARESIETEPQINADERRLNALSFDNIDTAFGKNREWLRNISKMMGLYQNQSGKKLKPLAIINDKINATNLRLSAFICGLNKSQKTKQPDFILKLKNHRLLFSNNTYEFKNVHLRLDLR
ncbi:MAG: hypothetical protein KKA10_14205 [Euryarchaeota archaeon]|nr:hypothetical protein [Euryarchaeota archaeon]MCG2735204.1 hypothetical protein [Candidatus Methanoperedenaceae archaeon]